MRNVLSISLLLLLLASCDDHRLGEVLTTADSLLVEDADSALRYLEANGLHNITAEAKGTHGAKATYRYQGRWQSIDHILVTPVLLDAVEQTYVNDAPFLLEEDKKYGGVKPLRTFNGYRYQRGFSDHLPLVVRFNL